MKVVSVLTSPVAGGAEYAAVALLDALCARGHEAVVLTDLPGIARGTRVRERGVALGPKLGARSFPRLALRWPLLRRRLVAALDAVVDAEGGYDLLLTHFKKEQLLAADVPARLRPALAWAEWGPVPFPLRHGLPAALYRRAGRDVRSILCVSEGTRRSVVAVGLPADRAHVVPNVVSADAIGFRAGARTAQRAALGIPDDAFVVGCMSRLHPKKRNDVLVDAVLRLDDPRVHLVFAGDGETADDLRRQAAPLGPRAHFVPAPGDAAPDLISAWDLAAFCPSPTEGAPLAIIVAMLCERPVVASGPEGAEGLIGPGAGAVSAPEHDPAALAALLAAYRDDPARRRAEGGEARRRAAEHHDVDRVAARAEALLLG